tara:strand:+ start:787 stop:1017 length:231 start_codon:yes stop_codon:yes gene_type:complete
MKPEQVEMLRRLTGKSSPLGVFTVAADRAISCINEFGRWTWEQEALGRTHCRLDEARAELRWILECHGLRAAEGEE